MTIDNTQYQYCQDAEVITQYQYKAQGQYLNTNTAPGIADLWSRHLKQLCN